MPQLVFRYDDGGEDVFALMADQVGIGSDPDNPIVINNEFVSTHHAQLKREEDGSYCLFDLGSDNGTFVNERAINSARLNDGDRIRLGMCEVTYEERAAEAETQDNGGQAERERLKSTQRITLEALSQQAGGYLNAEVANKRKEFEELERRVRQAETERDEALEEAEAARAGQQQRPANEAQKDPAMGKELARLEAKREEVENALLEKSEKLEDLTETEIPAAKQELDEARREVMAAANELRELQAKLARAKDQLHGVAKLEDETRKLRSQVQSLQREHDAKKVALGSTAADLERNEAKLAEMREELERIQQAEAESVASRETAEVEHRKLVDQNTDLRAAIKDNQELLEQIREHIGLTKEQRDELEAQNRQIAGKIARAEDKLAAVEAKLTGKFEGWDEFERNQLDGIVERKNQVAEECAATENKLAGLQGDLEEIRSRIEAETAEAEAALEDLRLNHYEPTKEMHEELILRNEDLANAITQRERLLDELRYAIQESEETERIVTHSLKAKGEALARLEQRVGEEVEQIEKAVAGRLRQPRIDHPPRKMEIGRGLSLSGPPAVNGVSLNGAPRTRLAVFDPQSGNAPVDFTGGEGAQVEVNPLPVGFEGLAAATSGAFVKSLAQAAEMGLPVLFVPSGNLSFNTATLKKLRSALPSQLILLGWRSETFAAMTETLDEDTHFQDLTALLSLSDGSLTADPQMNVFFESLSQGKRFLFLPPALPWNPRQNLRFEERMGIYIDATQFKPEDLEHQAMAAELREIIEASRQMLTVPEVPEPILQALLDQLELGPEWVTVAPQPTYKERLTVLGQHLANVSFERLNFNSPPLRDALLTRTLLIAPDSEALRTFFPETSSENVHHALGDPTLIVALFENADHYNLIVNQAERTLLDDYSYQAAARKLDTFVAGLQKKKLAVV